MTDAEQLKEFKHMQDIIISGMAENDTITIDYDNVVDQNGELYRLKATFRLIKRESLPHRG